MTNKKISEYTTVRGEKVMESTNEAASVGAAMDGVSDKLAWRPDDRYADIPDDVMEARLSRLGKEDRELIEAEINGIRDPSVRFLYFGGKIWEDETKNEAATMCRCAYVSTEINQVMRIFKESAHYHAERPYEEYRDMARKAMEITDELRDALAKLHVNPYPDKFRYHRDLNKGN